MKTVFVILILALMPSCRTIDLDAKMPDGNGFNGSCHLQYTGMGQSEIKGLTANICGGSLGVESSAIGSPVSNEVLACILLNVCPEQNK
jgi:hypothetical protein